MYGEFQTRAGRSISLLHGETDPLHMLIIATQRGGAFIIEANGRIGVWCVAWKLPWLSWWHLPLCYLRKTAKTSVLKLFLSNLFVYTVFNILCFVQWGKWGISHTYSWICMTNKLQLLGCSCTSCVYATFLGECIQRVDCVASFSGCHLTFCCLLNGKATDSWVGRAWKWSYWDCV